MGPVPGLNEGWSQIVISALTVHDQALPPVPPDPAVPGLVEGPAVMGWPPGTPWHKTGKRVYFDGNRAVQQGHDVGILIPHFAIPMNALCAVHTLCSKHKVLFPVSSVLIEGKPMGTYLLFALGEICCNPVSLPTGVVILLKCTVWSSMSWVDLVIGLLNLAYDIAVDLLWNSIKPNLTKGLPIEVLGGLTLWEILTWGGAGLLGRYILRKLAEKGLKSLIKKLIPPPGSVPVSPPSGGRGGFPSHAFFP